MFEQLENMLLNTLIDKLKSHGINIDAETVKKAIANSPQLVQQIEAILLSSNSQEKLEKIKVLINEASQQRGSSSTTQNK